MNIPTAPVTGYACALLVVVCLSGVGAHTLTLQTEEANGKTRVGMCEFKRFNTPI